MCIFIHRSTCKSMHVDVILPPCEQLTSSHQWEDKSMYLRVNTYKIISGLTYTCIYICMSIICIDIWVILPSYNQLADSLLKRYILFMSYKWTYYTCVRLEVYRYIYIFIYLWYWKSARQNIPTLIHTYIHTHIHIYIYIYIYIYICKYIYRW
jgi:hypothetical protein